MKKPKYVYIEKLLRSFNKIKNQIWKVGDLTKEKPGTRFILTA